MHVKPNTMVAARAVHIAPKIKRIHAILANPVSGPFIFIFCAFFAQLVLELSTLNFLSHQYFFKFGPSSFQSIHLGPQTFQMLI